MPSLLEGPPENQLEELAALSARIGADARLVQGPGGNTSLKAGGHLFVKGSGTWLAQALERPIFAKLDLGSLREAIAADDPRTEDCLAFLAPDSALRPSIETTLHAVLPHRVVVHVHCVETIAAACRTDVETILAERLGGLPDIAYAIADYARPGRPLTRAVWAALRGGDERRRAAQPRPRRRCGHGRGGGRPAVADHASALASPARQAPPPDEGRLAGLADETYEVATDGAHGIATDLESLAVATGGSLYPDHVIFLGRGLRTSKALNEMPSGPDAPAILAVPGRRNARATGRDGRRPRASRRPRRGHRRACDPRTRSGS